MSSAQKILQAAAGNAGEATYVEDVFSTYLYTGNASAKTITNGMDLDGEGGMVWGKSRSVAGNHRLHDSERGSDNTLSSNSTAAEVTGNGIASFNSDGFTMDSGTNINQAYDYASWTFRKAPKFFDVVTYTGNSTSGRTVSHNLGSVPGCIIIKSTTYAGTNWAVYHRSLTSNQYTLQLNNTGAELFKTAYWNSTTPTSTEFTLGNDTDVNESGHSYVAYLFAHNDGDGIFGENGDQDIIKCGSYTGNGTAGNEINLGFEPQWVLVKATETGGSANSWWIYDAMRGMTDSGFNALYPNLTNAEEAGTSFLLYPTATGFKMGNTFPNNSGIDMIYIAIRRGPMKTPESGTEVFALDTGTSVSAGGLQYTSGFPVDMVIDGAKASTYGSNPLYSRLTGKHVFLNTLNTNSETYDGGYRAFDSNEGIIFDGATSYPTTGYMFRRAPGFFDVVAYEGDGVSGRTVSHNLGVVPEMMIVKNRGAAQGWLIYHSALGATKFIQFNSNAEGTFTGGWNDTEPTSSVFTVGNSDNTNQNTYDHIAYLFATVPGVSKVGSYTGNGTSQTIDCGFSSGARLFLVKASSTTGDWNVFDTERGIVTGNDPYWELNTSNAEDTDEDAVDPVSSGITVNETSASNVNTSGVTYIFLAIA